MMWNSLFMRLCIGAVSGAMFFFLATLIYYGADMALFAYRAVRGGLWPERFFEPQPNWIRSWFAWCGRRGANLALRS